MNTIFSSRALAALHHDVAGDRVDGALPEVLRAVGGLYEDLSAMPHGVIVIVIIMVRPTPAPDNPLEYRVLQYSLHNKSYFI